MAQDSVTAPTQEPKISVRGLWKVFGHEPTGDTVPDDIATMSKADLREELGVVLGLKDVNFDVLPGETFVVMGLSGSGKSTLVRTLIRLIEPSYGQVLIDGEDILDYDDKRLVDFRRHKTAMVFQHFGLLPHRSVLENAAWALEVQDIPKAERDKRALEVLEMVGLKGWENYRPGALSGGMQQRVGLARAIASNADILLLDEPFSGLDPLIRRDMQNELVRLQETLQKTLVFITHDLDEALKVGTRIMIMRDGEAVQTGTGEEILSNPADDYVSEFVRGVRRYTVMTLQSMVEPARVILHASMSPKQAMEALSARGEVAGFVTDRRRQYAGTVSFAALAEASQRDDATIVNAYCDDVVALSADMSVYAAMPLVRHAEGKLPVINDDGVLIGQVTATAVQSFMEKEIVEEVDSVAVGTDETDATAAAPDEDAKAEEVSA